MKRIIIFGIVCIFVAVALGICKIKKSEPYYRLLLKKRAEKARRDAERRRRLRVNRTNENYSVVEMEE